MRYFLLVHVFFARSCVLVVYTFFYTFHFQVSCSYFLHCNKQYCIYFFKFIITGMPSVPLKFSCHCWDLYCLPTEFVPLISSLCLYYCSYSTQYRYRLFLNQKPTPRLGCLILRLNVYFLIPNNYYYLHFYQCFWSVLNRAFTHTSLDLHIRILCTTLSFDYLTNRWATLRSTKYM